MAHATGVPTRAQHLHEMHMQVHVPVHGVVVCPSSYVLINHVRGVTIGNQEGGIVGREHLLKDTGSGAHQHEYRTFKGTACTAEGVASQALLKHLKVCTCIAVA